MITRQEIHIQRELSTHMVQVPKVLEVQQLPDDRIMFRQQCAPGKSFWHFQNDEDTKDRYTQDADTLHKNLRGILLTMSLSCHVSHGDMHTNNVMMDDDGNFKIIDFGRSVQINVEFCISVYDCFHQLCFQLGILPTDVVNVLMNTPLLQEVELDKRNVIIVLSYLYTNKLVDENCKEVGCFKQYRDIWWKVGTDVSSVICGKGINKNVIVDIDATRFNELCRPLFTEDDYVGIEVKQLTFLEGPMAQPELDTTRVVVIEALNHGYILGIAEPVSTHPGKCILITNLL